MNTRGWLVAALAAGMLLPAAVRADDDELPEPQEVHGDALPPPPPPMPGMFGGKAGAMREIMKGGGPGGVLARYPEAREALRKNLEAAIKVHRAAAEYRKAQGAKREEAKKALRAALAQQFDARVLGHETRIQVMQKEVERLKERLGKRRGLKEKLVEKRLAELTSEEEGWEW